MKKLFYPVIILFLFIFSGCISSNKKDIPVGGTYDEDSMESLVEPPEKIPFLLRPALRIADKKAKKDVLPGRVLAWSSKIAISSGLLELYVEEDAADCLDRRLIKILRIKISYMIPSPFAVDINSQNYKDFDITEEEIRGLQGEKEIDMIASFSKQEKAALKYAEELSKTPVMLSQTTLDNLRNQFSEKEIVAIASLSAKVNYWARLIEALRIKPAGYTDDPILNLDEYSSFVR
ncbi:MAG: carboxymuconolactone decarboxylase family protein [Spirochaetota bacterium]|nr:carboxymuconolactone decarboxylase family protein [Spirochaetota bacterium]